MVNNIESIVRQYVPLSNRPSSKGWFTVKCRLCHDYRKRGGFKFDGGALIYNCFNCAHSSVFLPSEHNSIPSKTEKVLEAYGIPKSEFNEAIFQGFVLRGSGQIVVPEDSNAIKLKFNNVELPKFLRPLKVDGDGDVYDELACEYLTTARGIDPRSYPFLIADKGTCPTKDYVKWKGRLVIPYYRHEKVIFYQGRCLLDLPRTKYLSPDVSRDAVLYGFDEVYSYSEKPLYIHEGFFDAFLLKDSVAIFSNKISEQQVEILNRCTRPKVVIPDRAGKGYLLANEAIKQGWSVSLPDIGSNCKDMNDAILKYGRLYVLKSIADNTVSGFEAEMMVNMYCKE